MTLTAEQERKLKIRRTVSFIIVALAYFFVQFHRSTSGVIKADLEQSFAMTATSFATLSSMYFYPYMLMQLPLGVLLDKFGVRRIIAAGCLLTAIGSLIFGSAGSFGMACLGRALIGIGVCAPVTSMQKLISAWWKESKNATAFSTSTILGHGGALVAQFPLAWIISSVSWRVVFFVCMGISLLLAILCWFFVKNGPEEIGLPSIAQMEGRPDHTKASTSFKDIIKAMGHTYANKYMWPVIIVMMIHQGLQSLFSSTFSVPYLREVYGYTTLQATGFTTAMMAGMVVFGFTVGRVSDAIKSRKAVLAFISGTMIVCWSCLAFGPGRFMSEPLLWVIMFLMGMSGCGVQIMFSYSREINNPAYVGVAVTAVNFTGMVCSAFMPTVCGALIDRNAVNFSGAALYQRVFLMCIILSAVAFIICICLKETHCKNRYYEFVKPKQAA